MGKIKEVRIDGSNKKTDSYKVKYENGIFEFGFGKYDEENKELKIHTEFDLHVEEFKVYFFSIARAIYQYNKETGKNFIEELEKDE